MHVPLEFRRSQVQPLRGWQHSFVEIDHEIFSTVIEGLRLYMERDGYVSGSHGTFSGKRKLRETVIAAAASWHDSDIKIQLTQLL